MTRTMARGCAMLSAFAALAASSPGRASDAPERADFLGQYAATNRFTLGRPQRFQLTPDGSTVLFLRSGPRSFEQDLYAFECATRTERRLLNVAQALRGAAENLPPEERARRERQRVTARGVTEFSLSEDGRWVLAPLAGRLLLLDVRTRALRDLTDQGAFPLDPRLSPDGRSFAFVRGGELHVMDVASGTSRRLTHDAGGAVSNGLAEFVAQEEMDRPEGFWWSPDSRQLAYQQTDVAGVEVLHIMDPANPAAPPQSWPYPRAGTRNAAVRLGVIPAAGGATTWISWDRERYPYLAKVVWSEGAPLTLLVQDRRQREMALLAADTATGRTKQLLTERDPAWLVIDPSVPRWVDGGRAFLWSSERGGAWRMELRGRDGRLLRTVLSGMPGYGGVRGVDERSKVAWVIASHDPLERHVWRVPFDTTRTGPEQVTREPGLHEAVFARDGRTWVHRVEARDGAVRFSVGRASEGELGDIRDLCEAPLLAPRPEWITLDGPSQLRAVILRPSHFDTTLRYPVLLHAYGGPTSQMVQAAASHYLLAQWLAEQGWVVVSVDGRGTPGRGAAWARSARGDFTGIPVADQAGALRRLAAWYPQIDLDRVGVFGWSFGGTFACMAVMRHPELFRAGVAGAPVVDWADYDTHYTERYLGLPGTERQAYRRCNVLTYAAGLARPLLVLHGTADDNVYLLNSVKLTDALLRAGRDFDFLPLAGATHSVREPAVVTHMYERIVGHLQSHLGGPR